MKRAPAQIRAEFEQRHFDLIVSDPILDEYERALNYLRVASRHHLGSSEVAEQVAGIRRTATLVVATDLPRMIPEDPSDNLVLATAVAGGAQYIVSGDDHLHRLGEYSGIHIVSPTLFLAVLKP